MVGLSIFRADRRRWHRRLLNASVNVFTSSAEFHARAVTISEGGICVFTVSNLAVGSSVDLEFVPPQAESSIRVSGTVRSRALYLYGIEFLPTCARGQIKASRATG
jgi:PilZ domain